MAGETPFKFSDVDAPTRMSTAAEQLDQTKELEFRVANNPDLARPWEKLYRGGA